MNLGIPMPGPILGFSGAWVVVTSKPFNDKNHSYFDIGAFLTISPNIL
jgi:hypothetical protein